MFTFKFKQPLEKSAQALTMTARDRGLKLPLSFIRITGTFALIKNLCCIRQEVWTSDGVNCFL